MHDVHLPSGLQEDSREKPRSSGAGTCPRPPSRHGPGGQAKPGHTLTSLSRFVTTQGVCGDRTVLETLNFNEMPSVSDSSVLLPTASSLWFLSSGGVEGGREVTRVKGYPPVGCRYREQR